MRLRHTLASMIAGSLLTIMFFLSCGDGKATAPSDAAADAAPSDATPVCDCPAAEPPLAGRLVVLSNTRTLAPGERGGTSITCPTGATVLTGSCTDNAAVAVRNLVLNASGYDLDEPTGWKCIFTNNEAVSITIRVSGVCLKPAP